MTALDRTLAQTFRAARWSVSGGSPVCPDCFDGLDLEKPVPDPLTPGLSRYRCHVCTTEFSDVKETVFYTSKPWPLACWAYLVLLGDPAVLRDRRERWTRRAWELSAKIKGRPLTLAWRGQLEEAGITAERLRKYLDAVRLRDQPARPGGRAA
jgi:transposase-like protein